jgi:hypothetical protein
MYRAGPVSAPRWEPQNRHWPSAAFGVNAILTIPMPGSAIGILESRASDACLDCCSGRRLAGPHRIYKGSTIPRSPCAVSRTMTHREDEGRAAAGLAGVAPLGGDSR